MAKVKKLGFIEAQEQKWTKSAFNGGYTVLPHNLFKLAEKLGLRPTQQAVLFHLLDFWFSGSETSGPVSKGMLARRIGMNKRQVQRHLQSLEKSGLISSRYPKAPGLHAKIYSFDGLTRKLSALAAVGRREKKILEYKEDEAIRQSNVAD
jgi:DNA-binding transcriptional ArsR family regulator